MSNNKKIKSRKLKLLLWTIKEQIRTSKSFFVWKACHSVFDGLSSIFSLYLSANLITSVTKVAISDGPVNDVYRWLVGILLFEILLQVVDMLNRLFDARYRQKIDLHMNSLLINKMYNLSQQQFEDEAFNIKLGRAREGLFQSQQTLNELAWAVSSAVRFISSFIAIFVFSPLVGLVIFLVTIPIGLFKSRQNKMWEKTYRDMEPTERVTFRTRWMLIEPQSMIEVRLVNGFKQLFRRWESSKKKSDAAYYSTEISAARYNFMANLVEPFVYFGALFYFFRKLVAGALSLENFIFVRGLLEQAINSAGSLANSYDRLDELFINIENFVQVLETEPAIRNGSTIVNKPLYIEFKNVSFKYPGTQNKVLDNVSFKIFPGSKLALVGENGAGKTTLIKLLLRQYLPSEGEIIINGTNIKEVDQDSYYAAISNLSQDFLIVHHLSIEENLSLGIGEVAQESLEIATEMSGADDFISKLKHGYKERLDSSFDDGTKLSGGQLQRLGVARALLRGGDILVLDEPTSAIDAKAEYKIFNNIYKSHSSKTTLIVSHRFSTVRKADKIIVLENGQITEYGSHEELLKHNGLYKEMFEAQAEGYR